MSVPTKRIAVPRQWIGAPDRAWTPTLSLAVGVVASIAVFGVGLATGRVPAWIATPCLATTIYVAFTVLHDSMHGTAHRNRSLNAHLGRVAGLLLMLPLPLFRAAHLAHHSHTNDPSDDPDMMVARRPAWLRPLWFLLTPFHYRALVYGRAMLRDRSARLEAAVTELMIVSVIAAALVSGYGLLLLQLWVLPAVIAILFLALAFDLLPHHPHTTQERYYDTRIYPGRLLNALLLGQNYHLIHHLWTTIPWYHYADAFREVEADLVARGAPIGWTASRNARRLLPSSSPKPGERRGHDRTTGRARLEPPTAPGAPGTTRTCDPQFRKMRAKLLGATEFVPRTAGLGFRRSRQTTRTRDSGHATLAHR